MTFGFGPGADLMASYKANKNNLKKRRTHKEISELHGASTGKAAYKTMSEDKLAAFREKLLDEKRRKNKTIVFSVAIVAVLLFYLFYMLLF